MRWSDLTSGKRQAPPPLEGNVSLVVGIGTALWAVAFLAQLPFWSRYAEDGRTGWIWTCLVGVGLGLFGLWFNGRREAAIRRDAERTAGTPDAPTTAEPGDGRHPDTPAG
ncbi:DUF2530 domain-containing protein [Streptomyces bohaiensis]|uniref:DUF2530 domain-containing protein n=1 Tax=Streptomyces bohaiensis TaxID=1431344 RepID=UPI003B7C5A2D